MPRCAPATGVSTPRAAYRNERETWRAIADSGVPRGQLYGVTKPPNSDHAQVLPRWHIQLGNIVIPKSVHPFTDCEQLRRVRFRAERQANGGGLLTR